MTRKTFQIRSVAQMLGASADTLRRDSNVAGIEVARQSGNGPQSRLFTLENIFDLAAFRAKKNHFVAKRPVIATVYVPKGGVGKTTTSFNIGPSLSLMGLRVLHIDLDFQANLTMSYGYDSELTHEEADEANIPREMCVDYHLGNLLPMWPTTGERPTLEQVLKFPYGRNGPHLVPSDRTLEDLNAVLTVDLLTGGKPDLAIAKFLYNGQTGKIPGVDLSKYDVILFDGAPANNPTTRSALLASDFVIAPVSMEKYSTKSVSYLASVLQKLEADHGKHPELIIFGNFYDKNRTRVLSQAAGLQEKYPNAWLPATVSTSEEFRKLLLSEDADIPLVMARPFSPSAAELKVVAEQLINRMGIV